MALRLVKGEIKNGKTIELFKSERNSVVRIKEGSRIIKISSTTLLKGNSLYREKIKMLG